MTAPRRLRQRVAAMADARRDFMRDAEPDEELAVAGRRDRAGRVVGEGAGADDRAVADPARQFAGHPAGRGRGGEISATIARNSADRAVAARVVIVRSSGIPRARRAKVSCSAAHRDSVAKYSGSAKVKP